MNGTKRELLSNKGVRETEGYGNLERFREGDYVRSPA